MQHRSILACVVLGLAASSSVFASSFTFYGPIYSSYKKKLDAGGGCISGSIGTTVPGGNFNVTVHFVSEKNSESTLKIAYFGFTTFDNHHSIVSGSLRASVFTMCLKPGRYHLAGISALGQYSSRRMHIPFSVEAGKHSYLGSFVLHNIATRPQDCVPHEQPMFVEIRDEHHRDIPLIAESKHSVGVSPTVAIVEPLEGQPYFISCSSVDSGA